MTFEQFSAVVTPQRCMTGVKVVGAWNLGMGSANGIRLDVAQLGFNIAATVMCVGSYYLFKEIVKMMEQNEEMKDIRMKLEADIWDMEHGKSFSDQ